MKTMRRLLFLLLLSVPLFAQQTPNVGLNIPAHNTANWDVLLNANFSSLDLLLSGNSTVPFILVTRLTVSSLTVTGTCTGCGAGSTITGSGASSYVVIWNGTQTVTGYSGFTSDASGNVGLNTLTVNASGPGKVTPSPGTYANLGTCNSSIQGRLQPLLPNNSNTATPNANITATGTANATVILAFCDGTNWTVAAI